MKLYVFLIQRPRDREPWATVFTDRALAEKYKGRVSKIVELEVSKDENQETGQGPRNGSYDSDVAEGADGAARS